MGTRAARALHLALFLTAVVLYVVFILPRWWVLTGDIPSTLATAGRIAAGIPLAAAALPVMRILQAALKRKPPIPEIALRLRAWSAVLHVVAGVLILLAAITEIWLSLETGGPWLFAVYGAAGAIAILAFLGLYLSFIAEKPPAEPAPAKPAKAKVKATKSPRGKKAKSAAPTASPDLGATTTDVADQAGAGDPAESASGPSDDGETPEPDGAVVETATDAAVVEPATELVAESRAPAVGLRNKRPTGKNRRRLGR